MEKASCAVWGSFSNGAFGEDGGAAVQAEGRGVGRASRAEGRGSGASIRSSGGGRSSGRGWICRAELGRGGRRTELGWRRLELERMQPPAVGVGEARERVEGKERRGDEEGAGTAKAREARPSSLLACSVKPSFWSFRGWENQTPFGGAWGFWSFLEKQKLQEAPPNRALIKLQMACNTCCHLPVTSQLCTLRLVVALF